MNAEPAGTAGDGHGPLRPARGGRTARAAAHPRIPVTEEALAAFCRRHHIRRLALFGSVPRDDFSPSSDVDMLVEFESGHVPGFGFVDMQDELSHMVGRRVDLTTPNSLSRYFRARVLAEARPLYAAFDVGKREGHRASSAGGRSRGSRQEGAV